MGAGSTVVDTVDSMAVVDSTAAAVAAAGKRELNGQQPRSGWNGVFFCRLRRGNRESTLVSVRISVTDACACRTDG
jgi:hypothetical protein